MGTYLASFPIMKLQIEIGVEHACLTLSPFDHQELMFEGDMALQSFRAVILANHPPLLVDGCGVTAHVWAN